MTLCSGRPGLLTGWVCISWLWAASLSGQQARSLTTREIGAQLEALKETISTEVTARLQTNAPKGSYTTVWRQFEEAGIEALQKILPKHIPELTEKNFDSGRSGREKNRPADLAIVCGDGQIEISIKSARRSANPENDLGTFRDYPNRKKLFAASFTLWVRYEDAGPEIKADRVFFDRTWRFVGKSTLVDGVKYRKKDGNMRPKSWGMFDTGESFWKDEEDFEAAVKQGEVYRANELIKEYLNDLSESDRRLLYERLKKEFGGKSSGDK